MEYFPLPALHVRSSPKHGLGVFTREPLAADAVVERCAVLESMVRSVRGRPAPQMVRYMYRGWKQFPDVSFMPAGFGTMYNNGERCCNVRWELDMNSRCLSFHAIRDIEAGEELTIDYRQMHRPDILQSMETDHGPTQEEEGGSFEVDQGAAPCSDPRPEGRRAG